eukprot:c1382_g1_i1.p1 GENE.c1382_g1_i1~~c1382_g1_i1.p1  ORF type:complete len:285 (+),score=57.03 c1382_g1_i1:304-1158(+)
MPAKGTLKNLVDKSKTLADITQVVKDLPRNQAHRTGKYAPIPPKIAGIIVRKAKNHNRLRSQRRAFALAKELHAGWRVCTTTVVNVLKAHNLKFTRSRPTIALKPYHISLRVKSAEKWGNKPKDFWRKFIFSDEKTFSLAAHRHRQNDGLWILKDGPDPVDLHDLTHVVDKYAGQVSVWGAVSWWGKLKLCLMTQDEKHYCKTVISKHVKPFMAAHPEATVFQQDGAGFHTSRATVKHLNRVLGDGCWTRPPPPPCKERSSDGTFVRVRKTSKTGTTRRYKVDS